MEHLGFKDSNKCYLLIFKFLFILFFRSFNCVLVLPSVIFVCKYRHYFDSKCRSNSPNFKKMTAYLSITFGYLQIIICLHLNP